MTESTALTTTTSNSVFSGIQAFEDAQRIAKALASSTLIPTAVSRAAGFCQLPGRLRDRQPNGHLAFPVHATSAHHSWPPQLE
jgi:hypothetical protein